MAKAKVPFPSIPSLFTQTWQFYKKHWLTFAPILVIAAIPTIITDVVAFLNRDVLTGTNQGIFSQASTLSTKAPFLGFVLVVLAILSVIASTWATAAVLVTMKRIIDKGKAYDFEEAYRVALPYLVGLFFTELITGLLVLGGFILLVLPGFIVLTWGFAVSYVYIFEGTKYLAAFKRSRQLVLGNTFDVMLALAAAAFGIIMVSLLVSPLPFIGSLVSKVITTPFATYYAYLIYKSLNDSKR